MALLLGTNNQTPQRNTMHLHSEILLTLLRANIRQQAGTIKFLVGNNQNRSNCHHLDKGNRLWKMTMSKSIYHWSQLQEILVFNVKWRKRLLHLHSVRSPLQRKMFNNNLINQKKSLIKSCKTFLLKIKGKMICFQLFLRGSLILKKLTHLKLLWHPQKSQIR